MKALRLLLVVAVVCTVAPVHAQETMDELTLRQHMLQAEGKPPDQYREEVQFTSKTFTSTIHGFHRLLDYRVSTEYGPLKSSYGRFEGRTWDQDANGITTIHEPALGRERPMPIKVTISRVHQPLEAWRLARLDPQGFGSVQYIDPATYRVVRTEAMTRYGIVRNDFDDFRTVNGYTTPFHWTTDNEVNRLHGDTRVISLEPHEVADADLTVPPSNPFVVFPSNNAPVDIPATFLYSKIIVRVMVGNRGLDFYLDSGASGIAIDADVVRQLGIKTFAEQSTVTAGRYDSAAGVIPEMRVGDLSMQNVAFRTIPFGFDYGPYSEQRTKAVGLLGYDFIRSVGLTIDYAHRRLAAVSPAYFAPPVMTAESDVLPIRIGNHVPEISATINGASAEHVIVDTGATSLLLFDYFSVRYPEAFSSRVAIPWDILEGRPSGVGGGFDAKRFHLQEVDVGRYHLRNYDSLQVVSLRRFQFSLDGAIGEDFLHHFTVVFDYEHGRMFLVHNPGQ